ncbi:MAG: Peptidoglycan-binding LysM [Frankiales bacterium]|nr:Peptidoglycan-binding LysM [Frankiales bacterium]
MLVRGSARRTPAGGRRIRRALWVAAGLFALGLVLPAPATAWHAATTSPGVADPTAPTVAVLALVAWVLAGYVVLLAGLTVTGRSRGRWGRLARGTAHRIAPAALRQLMATALGVGLLVGTAGGAAAAHGPTGAFAAAASSSATSDNAGGAPALDWPTGSSEPAAPTTEPSLDWPTTVGESARPAAVAPAAVPAAADPAGTGKQPSVVVRPGDSLWSVAAAHLPATASDRQIAQAWPSWWAANRDVVGAEPDVLHPGQRLTPPADRT